MSDDVTGTAVMSARPADGAAFVPRPRVVGRLRRRLRAWLPEGRALPDVVWARRHRAITTFAMVQAVAMGLFAVIRGRSIGIAVFDAALIATPAALALSGWASHRLRANCTTVSLMLASVILVEVTDGVTEAHFHFFVMLGIVALYQDWVAFGSSIVLIVLHHAIFGTLSPHSAYGSVDEWRHPVRWALVHGGFVVAASVTHLIAWKANEQQGLADPLTRLPNRTAFVEALDRRLAQDAAPVSVLFVDLDNFKSVNDAGGHRLGDIALQQAAGRLQRLVREGDVMARLGGDEFAILISGDATHAALIAHRMSAQLQAPVRSDGREVFIQASIGVADDRLAGSRSSGDLLRDADLAMYLAKSSGKNQVVTYTAGVDKAVSDRAALAVDVRQALAAGQFEVHYQPLVRPTGIFGVEALLRWHHPERGLVPPAEFVPLAEEIGAIGAIGNWVLRTAADQVMRWRSSVPGCADLALAVNLSPVQLRDPDLITTVGAALAVSALPAHALTLEVTEGVLLQDLTFARRQLDRVRALGVLIAIDDFGTGYSSLSYLSRLPADQIKIDRSFVTNLHQNKGSLLLVKAIIDMARGLELDVLAEGVEVEQQQQTLAELGCASFQGYLYSKPLATADLQAFLTAALVPWPDLAAARTVVARR